MSVHDKIFSIYLQSNDDRFLSNYLTSVLTQDINAFKGLLNKSGEIEQLNQMSLTEYLILNKKTNILMEFANFIDPLKPTQTIIENFPNFDLADKNINFTAESNIGYLLLSNCAKNQISRFVKPNPGDLEFSFRKIFKRAVIDSENDYLHQQQNGFSFAQIILNLGVNPNDHIVNKNHDLNFIKYFIPLIDFSKISIQPLLNIKNQDICDYYHDYPNTRYVLLPKIIEKGNFYRLDFKIEHFSEKIFEKINSNNHEEYSKAFQQIVEKNPEILKKSEYLSSFVHFINTYQDPKLFQTLVNQCEVKELKLLLEHLPKMHHVDMFAQRNFALELIDLSDSEILKQATLKCIRRNEQTLQNLSPSDFVKIIDFFITESQKRHHRMIQSSQEQINIQTLDSLNEEELFLHLMRNCNCKKPVHQHLISRYKDSNIPILKDFFDEHFSGIQKNVSRFPIPDNHAFEFIESLLSKLEKNPSLIEKKLSTIFPDLHEFKNFDVQQFAKRQISYELNAKEFLKSYGLENFDFENHQDDYLLKNMKNKRNRM